MKWPCIGKKVSEKINLQKITGIIIGHETMTFEMMKRSSWKEKNDSHLFCLSIVTKKRTFDLELSSIEKITDFFVAVTYSINLVNPKYFKYVNKRLFRWHVYKLRLKYLAKSEMLSLP
jgi:hypothetical protein